MSEIFFILTTMFVGYVVYVVVGDQKTEALANAEKHAKKTTVTEISAQTNPAATVTANKPVPEVNAFVANPTVTTEKSTQAKPLKTEISSQALSDNLKNPVTGEFAKFPANYRFCKRWIKDALVEEGLLEKVYKNTELDDAANEKITQALATLRTLSKYQA